VIDSHCHLAGAEFAADLRDVVDRARTAGLSSALVILAADDEEELARAAAVAEAWPDVRFSAGIHPHAAGTFAGRVEEGVQRVEAALARVAPRGRAVGEIGLDYHYDFAPREVQQALFAAQLRLARRLGMPVVIHTREAEDDTFRILEEEGGGGDIAGVFHCFTGDRRMAERALAIGFHLSLAGIVSFPRAEELRAVAAAVPDDRLLVETDSPFLAPVPYRGRRNEPAHVVRVAEVIAGVRQTPPAALGALTQSNYERLFRP
jgi:TatD DNase family protein